MGKNYLLDSFDLALNSRSPNMYLRRERISAFDIPCNVVSCVSNVGLAKVLSHILMFNVEVQSKNKKVSFSPNDTLYVASYIGPEIPEDALVLPKGGCISLFKAVISPMPL